MYQIIKLNYIPTNYNKQKPSKWQSTEFGNFLNNSCVDIFPVTTPGD